MQPCRALIIGGYGFFGARLVERLLPHSNLEVIVAGRDAVAADALLTKLQASSKARLRSAAFDAMTPALDRALETFVPEVVVHTSGPFQGQDYRVAEACIRAGAHYIDLADGRAFVSGIAALDKSAAGAGVLVTSGASSVPALSSAAADVLALGMSEVRSVDIGIAPGNRTDRGLSTMQAVLSYCGQPIRRVNGETDIGWGRSYRRRYPDPVGSRLLSPCDVPDLDVLPARYPGTPDVRFGAGLELPLLHRGMNIMAAMTQMGLVRDWTVHARGLMRLADLVKNAGSDAGAMHVTVSGIDSAARPLTRSWHLVATHGDGPCVPTLAAAALVRGLADGRVRATGASGATACVGLLSLDEILAEATGLHITTSTFDG